MTRIYYTVGLLHFKLFRIIKHKLNLELFEVECDRPTLDTNNSLAKNTKTPNHNITKNKTKTF